MPRTSRKYAVGSVAVLAVLTTITACSSSGSSADKSGAATGGGATAGGATGSPITIGIMASETGQSLVQPERQLTAKAAIAGINAAGGVNGHKLQMKFCDTKNDPNGELSCMREFAGAKVSAVLAPAIIADQTGRAYAVASKAGIPVIGGQGLSPVELTTPGVFPLASGIPGWAYGSVAALLQSGAKKISMMGTNEPGSTFILTLCKAGLESAGVSPTTWVKADPQADPTFAAAAASAMAGGVDGILLDSSPLYIPKEVTALRQAGYTGKISSITAIFGEQILSTLGDKANGVLLTSQVAFPTDAGNAQVTKYLAQMKQYAPSSDINETSEVTWSAFQMFTAVMANSDAFGPSDVMKAFNDLSTPVDIGTAGPFQVKGAQTYLKDFPGIFNPTVSNGSVENGKVKSDGKGFINPFTALSALK